MAAFDAQPTVGPNGPIRLTRYFAIASAIIMGLAGLVLLRAELVEQHRHLTDFMARSAQSLNYAFANSVWPSFAGFVARASRMTPHEIRAHPKTSELDEAVLALAEGTQVVKIKIYDTAGLTVYSTDPIQIGQDWSRDAQFIAGRDRGFAGLLEYRDSFGSLWGPLDERYIYRSYVPVRPGGPGARMEGMMEIFLDVTELRALQRQTLLAGMLGIGVAFAVVFGLLVFGVWRAELSIQRHQQRALTLTAGIARAEAANRAKSEFLATMSHELRTPLNAVIGFADMIRKECMGPIGTAAYREYAEDIHSSGCHLLNVINDVLDLAKVESGKMDLACEPTDVRAIAEATARMVAPRAERGGIRLATRIAPGLHSVETDPRRLQQILLNLVGNAVKFTPEGGRVDILVWFDETGRNAVVQVCDTGIGMKEEDLPLALSPFAQLESATTRRFEGTGLGLPLARKLTEALGGRFDIESKPNVGTTVTLTLPLARKDGGGIAPAALAAPAAA